METTIIGGSMLDPPKPKPVASIDGAEPLRTEIQTSDGVQLVQVNNLGYMNDEEKLKKILPHTDWERVDEATWVTETVGMTLKSSPAEVAMFGDFAWAIFIQDEEHGVGFRPIMGGEMPNILYCCTPGGLKAFRLDTFDDDVTTLKWYWDRDLWKPTLTPGMRDRTWFGEVVNGEMRTRELQKI